MQPNTIVAVLLLALLSGCASSDENSMADLSDRPEFDDSTGAIVGLVTDESLRPVGGAGLYLDEQHNATTDDQGAFSLDRVPPGPQTIHVGALGYETTTQRIEVVAGQSVDVTFQLVALQVVEPYSATAIKAGEVMCSAYVRPLPGAIGACVLIDQKFMTTWSWPTFESVSGIWLETTWRSTQAAGNGLELYVPFCVDTNCYTYVARNLVGANPIRHPIAREDIEALLGRANVKGGLEGCETKDCGIQVWHYVYGQTLGSSSPADVGVLLQQKYEDYTTIFYNQDLPEQFSALPDA